MKKQAKKKKETKINVDDAPDGLILGALIDLLTKKNLVSMKDVDKSIKTKLKELDDFAKENPEIAAEIESHLKKQKIDEESIKNYIG